MSKKKKSVLEADKKQGGVTAAAVTAEGRLQKGGYVPGRWVLAEDEEKTKPAGGSASAQGAVRSAETEADGDNVSQSRQEERNEQMTRARYEEEKAEREAYKGIVREAYEDYRRNLQLFPEYMRQMQSGRYEDLLTGNDLIFQEYVKEMAEKMDKKNRRLEKQLDALTKMAELSDRQ